VSRIFGRRCKTADDGERREISVRVSGCGTQRISASQRREATVVGRSADVRQCPVSSVQCPVLEAVSAASTASLPVMSATTEHTSVSFDPLTLSAMQRSASPTERRCSGEAHILSNTRKPPCLSAVDAAVIIGYPSPRPASPCVKALQGQASLLRACGQQGCAYWPTSVNV